jgi:nucleoside-diphosphate-sugar epimerase
MRVLVTGANGFVGTVVCKQLLGAQHTVRAGVRNDATLRSLRATLQGDIEAVCMRKLGSRENAFAACSGVDTVIHLAARVHVMNEDPAISIDEFRQVNVEGTKALALAAAAQGVRRFVFVSTIKVNGESTYCGSFTEESRENPSDPYAMSKWEAEKVLQSIASKTGLEIVIVRPPLVYGAGVRANFLRLMKLLDRVMLLPLPAIEIRRSLIGVENLASCLVQCGSHSHASNQLFLVSDGEDLSTRELMHSLARALGRQLHLLPLPESALRIAARIIHKEQVVRRLLDPLTLNARKVRDTLNWVPPVSVSAGLTATARWYLSSRLRSPARGRFYA